MRILLHDYPGHAFCVELSRALAARGHEVLHVYSKSVLSPQGSLRRFPDDAPTFEIQGIALTESVDKESFLKRRRQEMAHGRRVAGLIASFRPDVVLCANTPLDAVVLIQRATRRIHARFAFWVQDLIGVAAVGILGSRLGKVGAAVGGRYLRLERHLINRSDAIILISEDFRSELPGLPPARTSVVENWAPVEKIDPLPKVNPWSVRQGLDGTTNLVYSGTLGMKHNPGMLVELAEGLRDREDVRVVLVSEGTAAEWVRAEATRRGLRGLTILPFQPFEELPHVLASADVLLALLEPDAGRFSVPSKVLSSLCSGRAVLLAVPRDNLAARIVEREGAGRTVEPGDATAFRTEAVALINDPESRAGMARAGRAYAERTFPITGLTDEFERILASTLKVGL